MLKYPNFGILFLLYGTALAANDTTYNATTEIINVNVYPASAFKYDNDLSSFIEKVLKTLSPLVVDSNMCIEEQYNNKGLKFYPLLRCIEVSDKFCVNFEPSTVLLGQLEEISQFLNKYESSFDNCSQVFKKNSSALSGYYRLRGPNSSLISVYCDFNAFNNCSEIFEYARVPSGYYTIQAPNGSLISVYCDMEGSNCDGKGGWMRVGYLNMSEPNATCPPGLTQRQYNNIDHDVCGRPNLGAFSHTFFSTQGIHYSKVCGQLRGYQYRAPDAFGLNGIATNNIDSCYVDGISITYGSSPRKHIWTYACGITSDNVPYPSLCCPCNSDNTEAPKYKPNVVEHDYYCESAIPPYDTVRWQYVLYVNDPLWDGQQCDGNEGPCCTNPKMPWFIKTLNETTTEDIELRVCGNEDYPDEDTPLDFIELYIR